MGGSCGLLSLWPIKSDSAAAKCSTVTGVLAAGRTKAYEGIAAAAGVFAKVLTAIGAGATTDAGTTPPTATPPTAAAIRAAQIQARNASAGASWISAGLAPMVTTHANPSGVGGLPKWALFALIAAGALVGGVLLARRAA